MMNIKKLREQIACKGCPANDVCDSLPTLSGKPKHSRCKYELNKASQILSLKVGNLTIKSILEMHYEGKLYMEVEGELPLMPHPLSKGYKAVKEFAESALKAGYKKVRPTKDLMEEVKNGT